MLFKNKKPSSVHQKDENTIKSHLNRCECTLNAILSGALFNIQNGEGWIRGDFNRSTRKKVCKGSLRKKLG